MRDTHATGTGSIMGAGTAGYCVGNLLLDGAPLPHEDPTEPYPATLASPIQVRLWSFATLAGMVTALCLAVMLGSFATLASRVTASCLAGLLGVLMAGSIL